RILPSLSNTRTLVRPSFLPTTVKCVALCACTSAMSGLATITSDIGDGNVINVERLTGTVTPLPIAAALAGTLAVRQPKAAATKIASFGFATQGVHTLVMIWSFFTD